MLRTYTDLMKLDNFADRFEYLKLDGRVGSETFGYDRYLNQEFYTSEEWRRLRRDIILRDQSCDLGCPDREIFGRVIVHHMNPIDVNSLIHRERIVMDPEFLICVSPETHEAIHYSTDKLLFKELIVRRPNDTCPWKERFDYG